MTGGFSSKKLQDTFHSVEIMGLGIKIILITCVIFCCLILLNTVIIIPDILLVCIIVLSQTVIMYGSRMTNSNAMALALTEYKWCTGTASSIFGFIYYCIMSLVTFGMGLLHNGTLFPMPIYFLAIAGIMALVSKNLVLKFYPQIYLKSHIHSIRMFHFVLPIMFLFYYLVYLFYR